VLKFIEGLPPDVIAIEASGKVTHEDYRNTLIPKAEAMMTKGPIKMLYVIGQDFTGFELEALWDDSLFGISHWHDFSHIAVVRDHAWVTAMVNMFEPFFKGTSGCSHSPACLPQKTGSRPLQRCRSPDGSLPWYVKARPQAKVELPERDQTTKEQDLCAL
jgi:hypothetical protein